MSKMQDIIDRGTRQRAEGMGYEEMDAIWDAIKLLSQGQQQIMSDMSKHRMEELYRTDIPMNAS